MTAISASDHDDGEYFSTICLFEVCLSDIESVSEVMTSNETSTLDSKAHYIFRAPELGIPSSPESRAGEDHTMPTERRLARLLNETPMLMRRQDIMNARRP